MSYRPLLTNDALVAEINFELTPLETINELSEVSSKKIWWRCHNNPIHTWIASPRSRLIGGFGCAICSGKQVQSGVNDLVTLFPEVAAEWDVEANLPRLASETRPGSVFVAWWVCSKNSLHRWQTTPNLRTRTNPGPTSCPACTQKGVISGANDFATLHPELLKSWDYERNRGLDPSDFSRSSKRVVWWRCEIGHRWEAPIGKRVGGHGCHYCSNQRALAGFNDFASRYPDLLTWWDYRNNSVSPESVVALSTKKFYWVCELKHGFQASPAAIAKGNRCPYCANVKLLTNFNDLGTKHPQIAKWWDYERNHPTTPSDVLGASGKSFHWLCDNGHPFVKSASGLKVSGCPVCANYLVVTGINDLATVDAFVAADWDFQLNKEILPTEVSAGSHRRIWWRCLEGHSWVASVVSRTAHNRTGCPSCAKSGFKLDEPAILYFIENKALGARKIGITNGSVTSARLKRFSSRGWTFVSKLLLPRGDLARQVEQNVLGWIREELGLSQHLMKGDMHGTGGETETFSLVGPSNMEITARIQLAMRNCS